MPLWESSEAVLGQQSYPSPFVSALHFWRSNVRLFAYSRVLITTDVWARGIDVQQVSLVINYDLPS